MRKIDHIVYCTLDLEKTVGKLQAQLGVSFSPGGRHLTQGTKNVLLNLGEGCYLEILTIDEQNNEIEAPRWMGIDLLSKPQITRWSLKTDTPYADGQILKRYNSNMGEVKGGERITADGKKLEWDLVMPLSIPEVEVMPFMTDWSKSEVHPTDKLPDVCKLVNLSLIHPNVDEIEPILQEFVANNILNRGNNPAINITIDSPNGLIIL